MKFDNDFESYMRNVLNAGHSTRPGADAPPSDTWQRVLAQVQSKTEEKNEMSTTTFVATAAPVTLARSRTRDGFGHYANLAAAIALVFAVAVTGWFATMQLNQPGSPDGRLALVGQVDGATCDVEPLSVDEVMEIVRNPYRYLADRADPDLNQNLRVKYPVEQELVEFALIPDRYEFDSYDRITPSEDVFEHAQTAVNQYIACAHGATYGQYWALMDPSWVQFSILSNFPVFASEEEVLALVEETIDLSVNPTHNRLEVFYDTYGNVTITANPDVDLAEQVLVISPDEQTYVAMGVVVTDETGEVIIETGSTGYPHQIRQGSITNRPAIVVRQSDVTGEWYVLPWLGGN